MPPYVYVDKKIIRSEYNKEQYTGKVIQFYVCGQRGISPEEQILVYSSPLLKRKCENLN